MTINGLLTGAIAGSVAAYTPNTPNIDEMTTNELKFRLKNYELLHTACDNVSEEYQFNIHESLSWPFIDNDHNSIYCSRYPSGCQISSISSTENLPCFIASLPYETIQKVQSIDFYYGQENSITIPDQVVLLENVERIVTESYTPVVSMTDKIGRLQKLHSIEFLRSDIKNWPVDALHSLQNLETLKAQVEQTSNFPEDIEQLKHLSMYAAHHKAQKELGSPRTAYESLTSANRDLKQLTAEKAELEQTCQVKIEAVSRKIEDLSNEMIELRVKAVNDVNSISDTLYLGE